MKWIDIRKLYKEQKEMINGTAFMLFDITTVPTTFALGTKINEKIYNSDWWQESTDNAQNEKNLKQAVKQLGIIKKFGWAFVKDDTDDFGHPVKLYRCAYCSAHAYDPTKECVCRPKVKKLEGWTPTASGILTPS